MSENVSSRAEKSGLPPGSLIHVGRKLQDEIVIRTIDYDSGNFSESRLDNIEEAGQFRDNNRMTWIDLVGLHDIEKIAQLCKQFDIDELLIEDILNTRHRPKVEEHDSHIFLTLKMLSIKEDGVGINFEQVSFVLGDTWMISFQEQEGDVFDFIRKRMRADKGNLRKKGIDFLFYRLIDTVVDNYFNVMEHVNEAMEEMEEKVLRDFEKEDLETIQRYKKQLIGLRRNIAPLREAMSALQREDSPFISEFTTRHFRDVYEHTVQINELIEGQRETASGLRDLYMTEISNRMNQIMKVLTIISTIFIPITFIAGIYGMNFDHIPELHFTHGYAMVWALMLFITIAMLIFFRRKKWL